jgi:hypothetical protein
MRGFADWPPIIRLAGFACNARGSGTSGSWVSPGVVGKSFVFSRCSNFDFSRPPSCLWYRCGEFGKTCALSALSALSRARELVRGKVPWPALGLWMGLARNLDADWRYFSAKKIVGGLFFTDMFEIPSAPRVSPPIHYHLTQDEWFCPGRRARIPDWLGALTMFKPAGVFLVPEWCRIHGRTSGPWQERLLAFGRTSGELEEFFVEFSKLIHPDRGEVAELFARVRPSLKVEDQGRPN